MTNVSDPLHCMTVKNIVAVWKTMTVQILILFSTHTSPVSLTFPTAADRDGYFDKLVKAVEAEK